MAWVIAVLGALLAAGGGVALWNGSGYIRLDWGQAQTVAGTVALSAGVVTLAIAAVLFALRDLARRPAASASPGMAGVGLEAVHLSDGEDEPRPPAPGPSRFAGKLARVGPGRSARAEPALPDPAVDPDATTAYPQSPAPRAVTPMPVESDDEPRTRAEPIAVPEAPRPASATVAEAPTVVGRYEANGASYVLFSDGTIEVETDSGTHRFASMTALKDHIERQDAG